MGHLWDPRLASALPSSALSGEEQSRACVLLPPIFLNQMQTFLPQPFPLQDKPQACIHSEPPHMPFNIQLGPKLISDQGQFVQYLSPCPSDDISYAECVFTLLGWVAQEGSCHYRIALAGTHHQSGGGWGKDMY